VAAHWGKDDDYEGWNQDWVPTVANELTPKGLGKMELLGF